MSLLKRLSLNLTERMSNNSVSSNSTPFVAEQREGSPRGSPTMPSNSSFNDFSMLISQEVDLHTEDPRNTIHRSESSAREVPRRSYEGHPSSSPPFTVGSAPAGIAPITTRSSNLLVPTKASVAAILGRMDSTPRSSLDQPSSSTLSTPRASFSDDREPGSPRSPQSPGSRRRRQQKIHGMDYYEFCELVRAGSL